MDVLGAGTGGAAPADGPPWLVVTLAVIALAGALGPAYVPVLQERVKARATNRADPPPTTPAAVPAPPTPPPPTPRPSAGPMQDSFDLVEEAVADAFRQRDAATARVDRMQEQIDALRDQLATERLRVARLEARERHG